MKKNSGNYLCFYLRMNRFVYRLWMASFVAITALLSLPAGAQKSQNVLFIAIDDLKTIGSLYSEEQANFLQHVYPDDSLRREVVARMTPNLQRLANQSLTFMNAYTASPACNPSRAALMTGIRPHRTGLVANEGGLFFREWEYQGERPLADATSLPELLKANGWYTASTGKIYHNPREYEMQDGARSWTDWTHITEGVQNYIQSPWSSPGLKWGSLGEPTSTMKEHNDFMAADFIASVLENGNATHDGSTFQIPENKPFFIACGIFKPHLPFSTTQDMLDLFPVEEMTVTRDLLEYFINDVIDIPAVGLRYTGGDINDDGDPVLGNDRFVSMLEHGLAIDPDDGDLKGWKDMLMHYFACVATADRSVGRLLEGLENSPYADNTMVILWSDHGYHLGEKLHETKFTFWEDACRVYFIVKDPRNPQSAGQRCYQPVSLIDIYPTVTRMAGLELPDKRITGRDLFPLLENPASVRATPALTTFRTPDSHMVRADRFKLIRYEDDDSQVELYDLRYDAEEYFNLADVPGFRPVLKRMKSLMETTIMEGTYKEE